MAIVTIKAVRVNCNQEEVIEEPKFFGGTKKTTINNGVLAEINTYYVLCKDDNDETLQNIIDSFNRISLGIGTKFDALAQKAVEAQPEYVDESIYNEIWERKSFYIQGVYYRLIAHDDFLELIPLYYWMYKSQSTIPCDISNLDRGDITKDIEDFIDRVKNTYSKYVKLYETRKEGKNEQGR